MPKRTLNQTVVLIRSGQRVELPAGSVQDLTTDEIADIVAVSPEALTTTATVDLSEEDGNTDGKSEPKTLTPAEKKAAEKAAKDAQKAATGPASKTGDDL